MSTFRLVGLEPGLFDPFFAMDADALAAIGARRVTADSKPGYPCRISLEGADVAPLLERMLADDAVAFIHLHNAKRGCFSCKVERA